VALGKEGKRRRCFCGDIMRKAKLLYTLIKLRIPRILGVGILGCLQHKVNECSNRAWYGEPPLIPTVWMDELIVNRYLV